MTGVPLFQETSNWLKVPNSDPCWFVGVDALVIVYDCILMVGMIRDSDFIWDFFWQTGRGELFEKWCLSLKIHTQPSTDPWLGLAVSYSTMSGWRVILLGWMLLPTTQQCLSRNWCEIDGIASNYHVATHRHAPIYPRKLVVSISHLPSSSSSNLCWCISHLNLYLRYLSRYMNHHQSDMYRHSWTVHIPISLSLYIYIYITTSSDDPNLFPQNSALFP